VAISRAQIPESIDIFQEGGAAEMPTYEEKMQEIMMGLQPDFDESYKKYEERLASTVPARPKMNIFQAAAAMGRGLLSTPNTGVGSMYQGLGVGFDNISQKIEKDQAMYEQEKRDVARLATQMALEDERQAEKYLQDYSLELIKRANEPKEMITIEYDEIVDGETVTRRKRFPVGESEDLINELFLNNNGREIKPLTSSTSVNVSSGQSVVGEDEALKQIYKNQELYQEKSVAAVAVLDQVDQARALQIEVGPEDFGPFAYNLLGLREFVDGAGYGHLLEDSEKIAPQKALNQLSMSFTMAIVSQTKGAISNKEMALFISASPTLGSTYDGYTYQLNLLEKLASRDKDFYQDYLAEKRKYIEEKGDELNPMLMENHLELYAANWRDNNPFLNEEDIARLEKMVESRAGLDPEFNPEEYYQTIMNDKKRVAYGIEGVPDGYRYLATIDGKDYYIRPGGDPENPDDVMVAGQKQSN
jgi:hypothetical protein